MMNIRRILVTGLAIAAGMVALTACGQRGPLYLPTDPQASQRASLPQSLVPNLSRQEAASVPQQP